ncbi:hypothetical protein JCM10449v2_000119 [Rhodotorula kratochvilovae]
MSRDHKPPPLPLTQQPRRQRSLSTTSSTPAPLSPAYRLTERTRTITESMQAYTTERERRLLAVQDAWRLSRRLGGQVASLRSQIAQHPDDFSLRVKLNEAEKRRKEAKLREEVAKHALASPTMEGPPVLAAADDIEEQIALSTHTFAPASPLVLSSSPPRLASPFQSESPSPTNSPVPLARRPTRTSFSRASFSSTSSTSRPPSPILRSRPASVASPLSVSAPLSDPLPSFAAFPSHQVLVTSRLAVPGFFVVEELGLIQVGTPHLTDLAAIKALLRVEGVRRGAHAVLGVQTKAWEGEGGGLTGVGRAVRLRKG